jgi:molybdopterin converting factor small subunit
MPDAADSPRPAAPAAPGTLRVALFAGLAAAAGRRCVEIEWDGGTVAGLRRRLAAAHPEISPLLARSAVALDDAYATDDAVVPAAAAVAIIPPVSGG